MEWTTHLLSGVAAGFAVTGGDWRGAAVGGVAGVVSDLDEHKSRFGKIFFPISFIINKTVGHRTLTHSLLFVAVVGALLSPIFDPWVVSSACAGILAHIAGDMLTGKVKLFYPFQTSVGLSVSRREFKMIDKVAAIVLIGFIVYECVPLLRNVF
ncbi:hypothetical protein JNUCC1_01664 [Lentibacillus sp. JNUCC-1]|uniref:metal-dependent hydrolase n=1 Tax=Lentibacillus sp. JNUCC-1 TaxID=2654513 RepID=UPI0012E8B557|nr:metal-dependent hydrolase [Lentibacillus sp. JNUCC-1]MUV37858.1 hypothetical protein [Lentibacillus sp. JNUCC-1]